MKRKIAIFTGGRQDYYLLKPLILELLKKPVKTGFFLTGTHLSDDFGRVRENILKDKVPIWGEAKVFIKGDKPQSIVESLSFTAIEIAKILKKIKPDILVLLGDRYELLAAAQASMIYNIPIAHIHGGESTEGLIDEAIRHAITKMSHLHFVANKKYYNRIIQMGENKKFIFNYGAIGIDNIKTLKIIPKKKLFKTLNINTEFNTFLITYHPLTLDAVSGYKTLLNLLEVLKKFKKTNLVFTYPNSDTHSKKIIFIINKFLNTKNIKGVFIKNLGSQNYLNLIKYSNLVIGNSSSGIIEVPSLKIPTINIGKRQHGRLSSKSVINSREDIKSINNSIKKGMDSSFIKKIKYYKNPYGDGGTALKIATKLEKINLKNILFKSFIDLSFKQ